MRCAPCRVRDDFIDHLIVLHALRSGSETYEITLVRRGEGVEMPIEIEVKVSDRASSTSEVRNGAVNPFFAVYPFRVVPGVFILPDSVVEIDAQIKKEHPVIRNL